MAKKASPATAIHTVSPLDSCCYVLDSYLDTIIDVTAVNMRRLQTYMDKFNQTPSVGLAVSIMQALHVPASIMRMALAGCITSPEDVEIAKITARMIGTQES